MKISSLGVLSQIIHRARLPARQVQHNAGMTSFARLIGSVGFLISNQEKKENELFAPPEPEIEEESNFHSAAKLSSIPFFIYAMIRSFLMKTGCAFNYS